MRFRYFDSDGTEVEISSVDALKFRIGTGAVTPETLLYDAAVGEWAPAHRHQVFRFLVEEGDDLPFARGDLPAAGDDLLVSDPPSGGEESGDESPVPSPPSAPPPGAAARPEGAEEAAAQKGASSAIPSRQVASDAGDSGSPADSVAARVAAALSGPEGTQEPSASPASAESSEARADEVVQDRPSPRVGEKKDVGSSEAAGVGPAADVAVEGPDEPEADSGEPLGFPSVEPGLVGRSASPEESPPPPGSRLPEEDEPPEESALPAGSPPPEENAPSEGSTQSVEATLPVPAAVAAPRRDRPEASRARPVIGGGPVWALLSAVLALALGLTLVRQVESGTDPGLSAAVGRAAEQASPPGGEGQPSETLRPSGAPSSSVGNPGTGSSATNPGGPPEPTTVEMESLVAQVTVAASGDLAGAMADLQSALGVPERPPEAWLEGVYLAGAGQFPEVRDYWRSYGAYVASVFSLEEELFRGFVQNRVLKMGLDTATAAGLSARILERYGETAEDRTAVFDDLLALAQEASALHDTLAARSDVISHEPFGGARLSRDPVVEAVSEDPDLGEEIWSRMDRIFDLIERIQGLRPVSTLQLQDALLGGLELPDRGG